MCEREREGGKEVEGERLIFLVLQVFHVPLEERRYQFEELSFGGETRQSEIVREIQEKTGCDIEMTQVCNVSY